jgi:integrase
MATIYKRSQDRGKRRAPWYIGYTDHNGRRRTAKGFSDKSETERLAARLEDEARMIREGLRAPISESSRKAPLEHHLDAFEKHLQNRDVSQKQVYEVTTKIRRVFEGCGFAKVADIRAHDVETYLASLRSEGMSKQTSNHYLRAVKQFTRWLKRTRRSEDNPLVDVPMLNVQTDRRHDRRPLLPEEFSRLVAAAEVGPMVESIPGADRAMMYILSAWTGYRKGEIGSLTRRSLDLSSEPPTVTVQAVYSKRKRTDTQVLHPDVVIRLTEWLATTKGGPTDLLFPVSGKVPGGIERKTAKMMRRDLATARKAWLKEAETDDERASREKTDFLKYEDGQGRFADFHANRHTFITNLGRVGVHPKTAQSLARHSDIRLTMNVYSHTDLAEKTEAVRRLPGLWECSGSAPESQDGTDGQSVSQSTPDQTETGESGDSPEVLADSVVDATCHEKSNDVRSTPHPIRTGNLRFRRPMLYPVELGVLNLFFPRKNAVKMLFRGDWQ